MILKENLDSLLNNKEYLKILQLTETSFEGEILVYRVLAFWGLKRPKEALDIILMKNEELLSYNFCLVIELHVEILLSDGTFEEAKKVLKNYENFPYISQEVEEKYLALKERIEEAEKNYLGFKKTLEEEDIKQLLESFDSKNVIKGIECLKTLDIHPYIECLRNILKSFPDQLVRSLVLILLKDKCYLGKVDFLSFKGNISLNPYELETPFEKMQFRNIYNQVSYYLKDPSLLDVVKYLMSNIYLYHFPFDLSGNEDVYEASFICLGLDYLQQDVNEDIKKICSHFSCSIGEVEDRISFLKNIIEKNNN